MKRLVRIAVVLCAVGALAAPAFAEVKTRDKTQVKFEGMLGRMLSLFGGKAAKEGIESRTAVKGNRKATMSDTTGQIVDLTEEKVYDLDIKKKTYKVTTFAEIRKQMEEAKRQAEQSAREERAAPGQQSKPAEKDPNAKEYEVDFDIKNTSETKAINGFDTKKSVITVTVREKGKTLNDAGGMVMTTDTWLAAGAPSTKELAEFEMKYAQKIYGPAVVGASPQDMAMAMAMYPQMKPALDKMAAEGSKLSGTAILTDMRVEAVPPGTANQTSAAPPPPEEPKKKGLGGMLGGLKKMAEQSEKNQDSESKPQRAIIMTTSVEMLKLTTDVDAASVAMPAGFTEKK